MDIEFSFVLARIRRDLQPYHFEESKSESILSEQSLEIREAIFTRSQLQQDLSPDSSMYE